MKASTVLRTKLRSGQLVVSIGVYDPLSAVIGERAGFDAVAYQSAQASGADALPDVGIRTPYETVEMVRKISRSVNLPIIVDSEQGFGEDPEVCAFWTRELIKAGAAAQHIDDLRAGRCIWLENGAKYGDADEVAERIHAMARARDELDKDYVIIARTCCYHANTGGNTPEGFKESIRRFLLWKQAGADVFTANGWQLEPEIARKVKAQIQAPLFTQGGNGRLNREEGYLEYCRRSWDELHEYGYDIINNPMDLIGVGVRAMMQAAQKAIGRRTWSAIGPECLDGETWLELVGHTAMRHGTPLGASQPSGKLVK